MKMLLCFFDIILLIALVAIEIHLFKSGKYWNAGFLCLFTLYMAIAFYGRWRPLLETNP